MERTIMVILPEGMIQLKKFPGYYWCPKDSLLYTCKVSGILRPLTLQSAFRGMICGKKIDSPAGFNISVKGYKKRLSIDFLMTIKEPDSPQIFHHVLHIS